MTIHKTSRSDQVLMPDIGNMSFEDYIKQNSVLIIPHINHQFMTIGGLDLNLLNNKVKQGLILWLFKVNRRRIEAGLPLLITYEIVKRCPIWGSIRMPFRQYKLDKKEMRKKMNKVRTIREQEIPGAMRQNAYPTKEDN